MPYGHVNPDEQELRRELVYQLRFIQRLTLNGVLRALRELDDPIHVSLDVVRADIAWWTDELRRRYSLDADPTEAVGEALRSFDFIISRALRTAITPNMETADKTRALAVATVAQQRKVELQQAVGIIRPLGRQHQAPQVSSREARALLESARVRPEDLVPEAERAVEGEIVDE